MGNEYGQFKEWDYKEGLEFFMLDYPLHKKLQTFNKKLNLFYKDTAPLYEIEDSWDGFEWISADEKDNNVVSFCRTDKKGNKLVAIMNFSGCDYFNYYLGVDQGVYKAVICTDDRKFGGRGILTKKTFSP